MSSKITLLLISILISFSSLLAKDKYCNAIIHKFSGEQINCLLKMPQKESPSKLVLKLNAESNKKTIGTIDIDFLEINTVKSKFVFKLTEYYFEGMKGRTRTDYRAFLLIYKQCENYQTYLKATEYKVDKKGNLILVRSGYSTRYYFFKRMEEELPFDLTILYVNGEKIAVPKKRRVDFREYLKKDPSFIKFINANKSISVEKLDAFLDTICNG